MKNLVRLVTLLSVVFVAGLATVRPAAAAPAATCTASLIIYSTSPGTVTITGDVTHYADSGVAGYYTAGFLAGYALMGTQDIMVNNVTHESELHGTYTAVSQDGASSFMARYTGHVDLNTGVSTGHFDVFDGTGQLAGFAWHGMIDAQLITVPVFTATDTGLCRMTG